MTSPLSGARRGLTYLSAVPESRQEFRRACGRQAEPLLSLTESETSPAAANAAAVLQKVRLKHTINFPIAGVTFYCAAVSGLGELAVSRCAAFQSRMDVCVREQKYSNDGDITPKI